jgi:hypothetical protein
MLFVAVVVKVVVETPHSRGFIFIYLIFIVVVLLLLLLVIIIVIVGIFHKVNVFYFAPSPPRRPFLQLQLLGPPRPPLPAPAPFLLSALSPRRPRHEPLMGLPLLLWVVAVAAAV